MPYLIRLAKAKRCGQGKSLCLPREAPEADRGGQMYEKLNASHQNKKTEEPGKGHFLYTGRNKKNKNKIQNLIG
jgi:hypothetical protein